MDVSPLRVLIVDDHEAMRTLLVKVLTRAGFGSVREATSGETALALISEHPADLILVDQNMPGMKGADFISRARQAGSTARMVMITGDARAEAQGADALLVKPVSPRDLLGAIERVLSA